MLIWLVHCVLHVKGWTHLSDCFKVFETLSWNGVCRDVCLKISLDLDLKIFESWSRIMKPFPRVVNTWFWKRIWRIWIQGFSRLNLGWLSLLQQPSKLDLKNGFNLFLLVEWNWKAILFRTSVLFFKITSSSSIFFKDILWFFIELVILKIFS